MRSLVDQLGEQDGADSASEIGVDESGKGDYFGPLVVAGTCVPGAAREALAARGIRDSKTLSDARARELAAVVRASYPTVVVVIGPTRYNELHASMKNLNHILAWAHARVIEDLLERVPGCTRAISDQFADARLLERSLKERGRRVTLVQRPRAETDPIVAAASIVARAEFLDRLDALSRRVGMTLPKGAGPPVLVAGRALVARHGRATLGEVAKLHFRTTQKLGGSA